MVIQEKTCKCIEDLIFDDYQFYKNKEYQVDVYPSHYKIYNVGYNNYIFIKGDDNFNKHFKIIE